LLWTEEEVSAPRAKNLLTKGEKERKKRGEEKGKGEESTNVL